MTDRELMQQAYAVPLHEQLASVPESARLVIDDQDGMGTRFIPVGRMCHEAAAALRERLAQPETVMAEYKFQTYAAYKTDGEMKIGVVPEQEQKPVAWMIWTQGPVSTFLKKYEAESEFARLNRQYPEPSRKLIALYTTPPRREWVGLTRDEVLDIEETAKHPLDFARSIEAKLREKNNG